MKNYKYLTFFLSLNIAFQLLSDVTAGKLISVFGYAVSVTVLYFPITYIISDVLTEVYGFAQARRVLWYTLICSVLVGLFYQLVAYIPPISFFEGNDAYVTVFKSVPRIRQKIKPRGFRDRSLLPASKKHRKCHQRFQY